MAVRAAAGDSVDPAYVDQGDSGETPAGAARERGIEREIVKLPEAKRGVVPPQRRRVVERSFARATRLRRRAKDCERYPGTLADRHIVAFVRFVLKQAARLAGGS